MGNGNTESRLHIKELKEQFRNQKMISVDDFQAFYTELFGSIKKNTVSSYIYQLKKRGVIRNVSRGQYAIRGAKREEGNEYMVITMDISKSTRTDYKEFNRLLQEKIEKINEAIVRIYGQHRAYHISQGDEIQILFPFQDGLGSLMMLTLSHLSPYEVRYGISIGEVDGELKKNSWEMNGPIFWNARDQLEAVKKKSGYSGRIISGYSETDQMCNHLLPLINSTIDRITEKQWEAIRYELLGVELEKTLESIGISKTSYYERLRASSLEEILLSFRAIFDLMKARREIN
ncbi:SatD family protein [Proteiniclasticum sp. C24MP]|uniref:SatD family protein n=1 Tax=Proteiniclasticum sp. C24MP TaxID=3374101 RepID=UPI003754BBE1